MEKQDRRVRRTHKLLGDALIALAIERGYDSVTIKDITERADVAYVTFFRHYRDKDELLQKRLKEMFDELEAIIHQDDRASEGLQLFTYVQQHHRLFRMLLESQGTQRVVKQLRGWLVQNLITHCRPLLSRSATIVPPEVVANHVAVSLFGLLEWWLDSHMAFPPEQMAQIYKKLILIPTCLADDDESIPLPAASLLPDMN